jgi:hypothetical protein
MKEEPLACENHRHSMLIRSIDRFLISHRASWLNNCRHTNLMSGVNTITEWEEGV